MGSPITFSGFNQIDFNVVLNAIMQQESRPLGALQSHQKELQATDAALAQLAGKLSSLLSASSDLSTASTFASYSAMSSDNGAVVAAASSDAVAGRYDVLVNELARAQVTVSATTVADTDTTIVASGGTLTIGGINVTLTGPVTLRALADAINATGTAPATASIIETAPGAFRLLLTGKDAGTAHAFTVTNGLTGTTLAFTDTNGDGTSGDSAADNAVQASDASVLINNVLVTSASNTLDTGIPGVTMTLLQKDPTKTVVVTVARDGQKLFDRVNAFVSAYNELITFSDDQTAAANHGTSGTLGHDSMLRTLRNSLRAALTSAYGSGAYTRLAEIGLGFSRTGQLTLDEKTLAAAVQADPSQVEQLFAGGGNGAFAGVTALITDYTKSGGFVSGARTRVSDELGRLARRIDDMQARLAIRRAALQQEFIAADQAMSRLNNQSTALSSLNASLINANF